eukprot:TRINITY_DN333_c0_g2_i4.p3 TRINITY_DN333_c0_g2~~TRINITY_DN333_c0_g2_i4.p3  ORF type:complete len:310 (-),score=144.35 TRINITY_DN333_c0_g2_i4:163-1092(-)
MRPSASEPLPPPIKGATARQAAAALPRKAAAAAAKVSATPKLPAISKAAAGNPAPAAKPLLRVATEPTAAAAASSKPAAAAATQGSNTNNNGGRRQASGSLGHSGARRLAGHGTKWAQRAPPGGGSMKKKAAAGKQQQRAKKKVAGLHLSPAATLLLGVDSRKYADELQVKIRENEALKLEIKTLNDLQRRAAKEIVKMDHEKGDLPRMIDDLSDELRVYKDKNREMAAQLRAYERSSQKHHDAIATLRKQNDELSELLRSKAGPDAANLETLTDTLTRKEKYVSELEHKLELIQKSYSNLEKKSHVTN